MKNKKLAEALNEINDCYLDKAASSPKKRRTLLWIGAIAAVLAVALCVNLFGPLAIRADAVSVAQYPDYEWVYRRHMPDTLAPLQGFFESSMALSLSGSEGENLACSPANLYMALALTSELTAGTSRQQILDTLNADTQEALRAQANEIWNACYLDDKNRTLLANSLWLEEKLQYKQEVMDTLKSSYYTSVYQGDLGSGTVNRAISGWLNKQTGGLLKQEAAQIALSPETVLSLYSTVYYQAKWVQDYEFSESQNTEGAFHAPQRDTTATYMNKKLMQTHYYWGEDYGAVALPLRDGSLMWLILPDADKTVDDVLVAGEYAGLVLGSNRENNKYMKVNLSVPKFDIRAHTGLESVLEGLGVTDVMDPYAADFSAAFSGSPVWLSGVNQATRVAIDEEGVTAASYIELPGAGAAMPPEEIIDFILDRPFLFVITNRYNIPLFAGVVNEP